MHYARKSHTGHLQKFLLPASALAIHRAKVSPGWLKGSAMSANAAVSRKTIDERDEQTQLATDVLQGLSRPDKTLPCKWFYDAAGSELFEQITQTPEYYLTRVETALLHQLTPELVSYISDLSVIIEPGSGSSNKTRILLKSQPRLREYIPIDLSADFLYANAATLKKDFPKLKVSPLVCDFSALNKPLGINKNYECLIFF